MTDPAADDRVLPLLGRTLVARGITSGLAAWLEEQWLYPEHRASPHPFRITLDRASAAEAPDPLAGPPVRVAAPGVEQVWRRRGAAREWAGEGSTVRLTLETAGGAAAELAGAARIGVWGADPLGSGAAVALHTALCEALRVSGLVPLHAAAALPPGGGDGATAFLGRSGVGKSTTLLRLHEAGWTPLAEDLSWVDPRTGTLYGWDRGVRMWPHTVEAFLPGLARERSRAGPDGKLFLPYSELGVARVRSAPLARVAVLRRSPDRAGVREPLDAREGVRALWESVGVPLTPAGRAAQAAWIGSVARQKPMVALWLGPRGLPAQVGS